MKATKELTLVISNGEPYAIARRDEKTKKVVFYSLSDMDLESIEKMLNKENKDE